MTSYYKYLLMIKLYLEDSNTSFMLVNFVFAWYTNRKNIVTNDF